jgi:hypothetical protein
VPVWSTPAAITYGTALGTTQLDATANVPGTFAYSEPIGTVLDAGSQTLSATFTPTNAKDYGTAAASVTLVVKQAVPVLVWPTPVAIVYGTPLSSTQLDATANVPGTFSYSQSPGTVFGAGPHNLSVTFTPTNTLDFIAASASQSLQVNQANPMLVWATPGPIPYGTALSSAQLDATANVPGVFSYSEPLGALLNIGSQLLTVNFTPSDLADYTPASASTTLNVVSPPFPSNIQWIQEGASISIGYNAQGDVGISSQTPGSGYSGAGTCAVIGGSYEIQATCGASLTPTGGVVVSLENPGTYTVAPASIDISGFTGGLGFSATPLLYPNPYTDPYPVQLENLSALNGRITSFINFSSNGTVVVDANNRFTSNNVTSVCANTASTYSQVVYAIGGDLAENSLVGSAGASPYSPETGDVVASQYLALAHAAKAAGCKVVIYTVWPRGSEFETSDQATYNTGAALFNEIVGTWTQGLDYDFLIPIASQVQGVQTPNFWAIDNVHPTHEGQSLIAQFMNSDLLN